MRPLSLLPWLAATACGAPIYIPVEPPAVGSFVDTALDSADTGLPAGTPTDLPCSGGGSTAVTLEVVNGSGAPVTLWWRDFDCVEVPYAEVADGDTYAQASFDTHVWTLRDAGGAYLDHVVLDDTPVQTVEVR